jgi:hypothetical protein
LTSQIPVADRLEFIKDLVKNANNGLGKNSGRYFTKQILKSIGCKLNWSSISKFKKATIAE